MTGHVDVYISQEKIQAQIKKLGQQITRDFQGEELLVVCVLKGAFVFCADLVREIKTPLEIDFVSVSSYEGSTESSEELTWKLKLNHLVEGKNVLLVEDIVDTGFTLKNLMKYFENHQVKKLKLASLLFKPARLKHEVPIDYLGFEIEDKFVIGYGLDFSEKYRELPYIGIYHED